MLGVVTRSVLFAPLPMHVAPNVLYVFVPLIHCNLITVMHEITANIAFIVVLVAAVSHLTTACQFA